MYKQLSILIMSAVIGTALHSQTAQKETPAKPAVKEFPKYEFGIHGAPSYSIFFNEHPAQSPRNPQRPVFAGGMLGFSFQYNFQRMSGLRVEANYERKGDIWYNTSSWNSRREFSRSYASDRISYITVPVLYRASFGKSIRFFVNGGLYAAIRIKAARFMNDLRYTPASVAGDAVITENKSKTDITADTRPFDAGAVVGLGVSFPVGNIGALSLEARNNTGFVNVNANTGLYQNKFYNNSTNVILGLSLYLDRFAKADGKLKM